MEEYEDFLFWNEIYAIEDVWEYNYINQYIPFLNTLLWSEEVFINEYYYMLNTLEKRKFNRVWNEKLWKKLNKIWERKIK